MKRMLVLAAAVLIALPVFGQGDPNYDPDRKKTGTALYYEGLKAETEKPVNLALAMTKYKKAIEKAKNEKNSDVAAAALARLALCNEKLDPENIGDAITAWSDVASNFTDVKVTIQNRPVGELAKAKVSYKGVDVWLSQLHASLDGWRLSAARSPLELAEKKKLAADKILPCEGAVAGLLWGLDHDDEVIRDFSAENLAEVVDEAGVKSVIEKLNGENPRGRSGASTALRRVFQKFNDAAALDQRASDLERDLNYAIKPDDRPAAHDQKLRAEAGKLREAAGKIRIKIPATLATPEIQGALEKIIADENAHVQARREAAQAAAQIGNISGPLVEAVLKGMVSRDRNVREGSVRAAGAVNTALSEDKHKLADALIKIVRYEPAKEISAENEPPLKDEKGAPDWANDEPVRQAAAEALNRIALVKTLPALIEALDDNDTRVRHAAHLALREITRRDFDYEPDKSLKDRKEAQAKWQEWWNTTKGVVVLVERFWLFQSQWRELNVVKLFDPEYLLKDVESRKWSTKDYDADLGRVKRVIEDFQRRKDVFVQDGVDLGAESLELFEKFIGGVTERDPKPSPATRYFVAQVMAKLTEKGAATGAEKLRTILSGSDASQQTGAALGLGYLPKASVGQSEKEALQARGLEAADPGVKEAAALALGRVGDDGAAAALTKAAQDTDANVQIAALRALSIIHPKNADTVKALGDMIGDEPEGGTPKKSPNSIVREYATDALGSIGDPQAMASLLRARRDSMRNVREAAILAVQKVFKADAAASAAELKKVFTDEKRKTDDRSGAALALGDSGDPAIGKTLSEQLVDQNPPRVLRDQDPGVRIKICEAIGNLKEAAKKKAIVGALVACLRDENEREAVRDAAYEALKSVFGINPDGDSDKDKKFKASDPRPARDAAGAAWLQHIGNVGD
jgi:HEAT repeat protein